MKSADMYISYMKPAARPLKPKAACSLMVSFSFSPTDPHVCTYVWTQSVPHTHAELHGTLHVESRSPQPSPERRWKDGSPDCSQFNIDV